MAGKVPVDRIKVYRLHDDGSEELLTTTVRPRSGLIYIPSREPRGRGRPEGAVHP